MKTFYLNSIDAIHKAATYLLTIKPEDEKKVTISDQGTKLAKMARLDRLWDDDIAKAGIGGYYEDTDERVHNYGKLLFALPIMIVNDEKKADDYHSFLERYGDCLELRYMYAAANVRTRDLGTKGFWKYLQDKKNHYLPLGVNLTDPALQGLDI